MKIELLKAMKLSNDTLRRLLCVIRRITFTLFLTSVPQECRLPNSCARKGLTYPIRASQLLRCDESRYAKPKE